MHPHLTNKHRSNMADIINPYHFYGDKDALKPGNTFHWKDLEVHDEISRFARDLNINPNSEMLKMFIGYHNDRDTLITHIQSLNETIANHIQAFYKNNPNLDKYEMYVEKYNGQHVDTANIIAESITAYDLNTKDDIFIYIDCVELNTGKNQIDITYVIKAVNVQELEVFAKKELLCALADPQELTHQREIDRYAYFSQYD